ncbi:hypothetical protein NX773_06995 [Massilia solisilvae]|uniref:Uncharacterized protein n=1 Tax=Massilia solisilvae TaxID=1811225 RepID=A0ABT2BHK8_9BURK|nr:hypothetical protein [Massilia solisilvae]MCS0607906.1 hypothetical protein [Massilia solisilvae]
MFFADAALAAQVLLPLGAVAVLAWLFANAEIHIEGDAGWAAALPTWRIEEHWLLDIFWGGRPLTGYHVWVFSFVGFVFHFPLFFMAQWSPQLEARVAACVMFFWIVEDYLWFVLNPAFGWRRFKPAYVSWHKRWVLGAPVDYWMFAGLGALLYWLSF